MSAPLALRYAVVGSDELSFLFVYEICALLEYYAALSGCCVPTFRDNLSVPSSRVKILEDWAYRFSRNVGTELPLSAA